LLKVTISTINQTKLNLLNENDLNNKRLCGWVVHHVAGNPSLLFVVGGVSVAEWFPMSLKSPVCYLFLKGLGGRVVHQGTVKHSLLFVI
jgi:hypothetical protein